jgi:hypothetical protein
MASACGDIMFGWGEALLVDWYFTASEAHTGQDWFHEFRGSALELSRRYSRDELAQMYPGSSLLLEMLGETAPDSGNTGYQTRTG